MSYADFSIKQILVLQAKEEGKLTFLGCRWWCKYLFSHQSSSHPMLVLGIWETKYLGRRGPVSCPTWSWDLSPVCPLVQTSFLPVPRGCFSLSSELPSCMISNSIMALNICYLILWWCLCIYLIVPWNNTLFQRSILNIYIKYNYIIKYM